MRSHIWEILIRPDTWITMQPHQGSVQPFLLEARNVFNQNTVILYTSGYLDMYPQIQYGKGYRICKDIGQSTATLVYIPQTGQ